MNARELCDLRNRCVKLIKAMNTGKEMLPSGNIMSLKLNYQQANELTDILQKISDFFDWKLDQIEVNANVSNKTRTTKSRKRIHE